MQSDVAFVISDLDSGGAQKVLTVIANYWAHQGHRVTVITLDGAKNDHFSLSERVGRVVIPNVGPSGGLFQAIFANLRRILAIRAAIKRSGAPVVVAFLTETNILVVLATVGLNSRVIISERNDPSRQSFGRIWDFLRRQIYRYADIVSANSKNALAELSTFVPEHKLVLIHNPPPSPASKHINSQNNEQIILNVGRLHPQKGQDVLLRSFAQIGQDWKLIIVGEGENRTSLEKLALKLGVSDRVYFVGRRSNLEIYYQTAKIFALPSRYEGMPNALLEAMNYGIPPVISNTSGGALEFVRDGETGLIVPVDDVEALATALTHLSQDEISRKRIGAAARAQIELQNFESVIKSWEEVLDFN